MNEHLRRIAERLAEGQQWIAIYCDLEPLHPKRHPQRLVQLFHWEGRRWQWGVISSEVSHDAPHGGHARIGDLEILYVEGDVPTWKREGPLPRNLGQEKVRAKWSLACPDCGRFPVEVRQETLHAVLDKIRDAGHDTITLRQLAAILSSG
ncbi:hypothetical protein [Microbacterium binotii]|uniref:hypothetical protein n=1 Tax=Microbacterium binotii TaxID=462710 RepID=UPI001F35061E|nr:hypothetical protein [Microbacterium binotii]UIN31894.1 hypothetical protein LXM64_06825 [Microbacterium binotii]